VRGIFDNAREGRNEEALGLSIWHRKDASASARHDMPEDRAASEAYRVVSEGVALSLFARANSSRASHIASAMCLGTLLARCARGKIWSSEKGFMVDA
jgi:hypothetical protein